MKKALNKDIILSLVLERALKTFMPVFGNQDDIDVVENLGRLKAKLATVDNKAFRKAEEDRDDKALTPKMKEIQRDEKNLIYCINKRNFDF
jgi:hypothetical protein